MLMSRKKPQLYSMDRIDMNEKKEIRKERKQQEVVTLHEDQQSGMYENIVISHYT